MFPNSTQQWSTGPSADLISTTRRNIGLIVGNARFGLASLGFEHARELHSASSSSLTAAGIATPKLTISLKESQGEIKLDYYYYYYYCSFCVMFSDIVCTFVCVCDVLAGDGIIYSFSFGVVLDLMRTDKPSFETQLALSWQYSSRFSMPWRRQVLKQTLVFDPQYQLDGPQPTQTV